MNLIETFISAEFTRAFAWTLFHSLWQGGLIALMAAVVITLLKRHKPELRYTILCVLLFMLPVLFAGTFAFYYSQGSRAAEAVKTDSTNYFLQTDLLGDHDQVYSENNQNVGWRTFAHQTIEKQASVFFLIWMSGFLFFLIRFAGSLFLVHRLKNGRNYELGPQWEDRLKELSAQLRLRKRVRLLESAMAKVPMTIGYLKPVILLPVGTISGVPPLQLDAILLHELAHILRKDYLVNILQSVIELLFFYHPATWWISGLIRQEREHICDDLAVNVNHDHINYIKALTIMEELNANSPVLASAITGSKKKLLARVKRLISPGKIRKGTADGIIVFLVVIGIISALSLNALSTIPDSYDLTGRESGERTYNILPFLPSDPDTVKAVSRSGNVTISVYSDTVTEDQQKAIQQMAESIDKKAGNRQVVEERYIVSAEVSGNSPELKQERSIVVISMQDSAQWEGDEYSIKMFRFNNDTIDTLVFLNPEEGMNWKEFEQFQWNEKDLQELLKDQQFDLQELQLSEEEFQDQLKDIQIEIEKEYPENEIERNRYYFSEPITPPVPPDVELFRDSHGPSSERIIRQELRDDGLTERGRKYVVEVDARSMYINGEKQPKEIYKKYKKLVESLVQITLEGTESFKLIF